MGHASRCKGEGGQKSRRWPWERCSASSRRNSTGGSGTPSSFSRLPEVGLVTDRARGEIWRRGWEQAKEGMAVPDGAQWLQSVVDAQRPEAGCIRDFPLRPAPYVSLPLRKQDGPARVLRSLPHLSERSPSPLARAKWRSVQTRKTLMPSPTAQRKGWPGKLEHINGMLALRTADGNARGQEAGKQIRGQHSDERKNSILCHRTSRVSSNASSHSNQRSFA